MKRLLIAAAAFMLLATTAHADSKPRLPVELYGTWCQDLEDMTTYHRNSCTDSGEGPLIITAQGTAGLEYRCTVQSIAETRQHYHIAKLKCHNMDGNIWSATHHIRLESDGTFSLR